MNRKQLADRVQLVVDGLAGLDPDKMPLVLTKALESLAETRIEASMLDDANTIWNIREAIVNFEE